MAAILGCILVFIFGFTFLLTRKGDGSWLPEASNPPKREFEKWCLVYTGVWIAAFGFIVVSGAYEHFDEVSRFCPFYLVYSLITLDCAPAS